MPVIMTLWEHPFCSKYCGIMVILNTKLHSTKLGDFVEFERFLIVHNKIALCYLLLSNKLFEFLPRFVLHF